VSVSQLPSKRWRAQTYNPATGKFESSAKILGLKNSTFKTKKEAQTADVNAAKVLKDQRGAETTLADWAETWTTDPLFQRPKESTNIHNRERIARFVAEHGSLPLAVFGTDRGDQIVAQWIAGGRNLSTVPVLKAMFNDAASAKAGRLVRVNPFAGLKLSKGKGRAEETPPSEDEVALMLEHAVRVTAPGFSSWLGVAAWSGMRPGELDALRWDAVDFNAGRILVREQWNVKERAFSLPKNGKQRTILLTPQARETLLRHRQEQPAGVFCFQNSRGQHWTPSARSHHWDRVRALMGWLEAESRTALYLATRHFAGWYLYNVLELPAEDVAIQLGHEDGGLLVRQLYGHRDRARTLARIERAFADQAVKDSAVGERRLRMVEGEGA
jgi:integrase